MEGCPSNEYLKIGGSIYGFYTHGIAIGFDHTERYTEEAIAAGGGYRDAEGTWRLNGWWFCYDDGTYPHGEWEYLAYNGRGDWYYFDEDGWMEDGWLFWNNSWYYLHTGYDGFRGHMYTGWHGDRRQLVLLPHRDRRRPGRSHAGVGGDSRWLPGRS